MYKGEDIRPLSYSDAVLRFSDHKPVYAAYRVKVDFVDEAKKQKIINEHKQPGLGEEPSLLEIAENINSNDSKSNKGNRPAPPPVPSKRNIDNITVMQTPEPSSATIVDVTTNRPPPPPPPPIRKATTLPPGFDHGMTLKPRNASSTSISLDTSKNVPSFDEFKEENTVSSSISEKSGTPKLSNWQPLTPK